jgi:hypothetical protein
MAIDGKRIQRVTKEGLFYLDDKGEEAFIDFAACYERKLAEFMKSENLKRFQERNQMSDERLAQFIERRKKESRYVADRNSIGGEPMGTAPYIEFYTDPPTRFVFENEEKFQEIGFSIEFLSAMPPDSATQEQWEAYFAGQTGWRTFDLS